eukprot:Plantae.Rhodophyta-Hildenbrandia_rubra.ctg5157.p1 GENE.Plantae.Rhodophyta-Hildenbrandia_rubra.ctg5157~~Plantae.Rhodophyta-Hildenbrandia_rubra.ctg5157.p1  ORF type:complete len:517 (-),score=55.44 Plantae.Rhodophyta-Hildenbrandia_rubra.ctg5157:1807-3357(-)
MSTDDGECPKCIFEKVITKVNRSLLDGHSFIHKDRKPVAASHPPLHSSLFKRELGETPYDKGLCSDDVRRALVSRLGQYRAAWRGGNSRRWNIGDRARVTALGFYGGPGSEIKDDKVVLVSGDWEGELRAIVFDGNEAAGVTIEGLGKANLSARGKGCENEAKAGIKHKSFTRNDWAFTRRVNGLAVDWQRGGLAGCSNYREVKSLKLMSDGHLVVDRNFGLEKDGRTSPVPKCITYTTGNGRLVVGDSRGRISLFDPRSHEPRPTIFAQNEEMEHARGFEVTDVSTCPASEHLLATACWRGPIRLFDLRKPNAVLFEKLTGITSSAKLNFSGTRVAGLSKTDNFIRIWNVSDPSMPLEAKIKHCPNEGRRPLMAPFLISIRPAWITDDIFMIARYDSDISGQRFGGSTGRCGPIGIYDVNENRQVATLISPLVRRVSMALASHPTRECIASATVDESLWIPGYIHCNHDIKATEGVDDIVTEMLAGHEGLAVTRKRKRRKLVEKELEMLKKENHK